jgi:hypothetical protein
MCIVRHQDHWGTRMTPLGLLVMRRTATLLHAAPGLRARITHDGRPLLDVVRPRHPGDAPSGRWMTPCAFRVSVGRAVDAVRAGKSLAVLGLEAGVDPAVELGASSGTLLPGGIVHLPTLAGGELAFATTAGAHLVEAMAHAAGVAEVRCHPDELTETALVVQTVAAPAGTPAFAAAVDRMQTLLARSAVRELTDQLDAFLHRPGHGEIDNGVEIEAELTLRQSRAARRAVAPSPEPPQNDGPSALD